MTKFLSTSNLRAPNFDRLWSLIENAVSDSGEIVEGAIVRKLEQRLQKYHDSKYCVLFSTGFWALVAAAKLRALPGRSEVIIPSFTYRRLADVVFWTGCTPVFADIDRQTLAICPNSARQLISDRTALILAVHPIVNCCPVTQLIDLANENSLPIIFDAVESVHETYDGQRIGSFGVGEVFSLHASKLINGLEGGYVCTNSTELRDKLVRFRDGGSGHGTTKTTCSGTANADIGLPSQLCDVHAAFAISELDEIETNVSHNRKIYLSYRERLSGIAGIRLVEFDEVERTSFKNIVVEILPSFSLSRDELVSILNSQHILARAHYSPPLHTKEYRFPVKTSKLPATEWAANSFLNLPCGSRVAVEDVDLICGLLKSYASKSIDGQD